MAPKTNPSKGRECRTITGHLCRLHTKRPGEPKVLSRRCPHCSEWRCRAHCDCDRKGTAAGRSAARNPAALPAAATANATPKAAPKAAPKATPKAAPNDVVRPVGGQSHLVCQMFFESVWREASTLGELAGASSVILASYCNDEPVVQECLLKKLRGRAPFQCEILVDKAVCDALSCYRQVPRLRALRDAGAAVYLCKGEAAPGTFHVKALVLDGRVLYCGSANITRAARINKEVSHRVVGPSVLDMMNFLAAVKQQAVLLEV